MTDQNDDLPKVPPFVIKGTSAKTSQEPASQPRPVNRAPVKRNGQPSERGMLSIAILLISLVSLAIAMVSGAWVAYNILGDGDYEGIWAKVIVVGLAYFVGWIVGLFGIRVLGNLVLPIFIQVYAWIVLAGIVTLQITIISKLFKQQYEVANFGKYTLLFGAGLIALVGLHLLLENHSLVLFAIPILLTSLAHLYFIVFHYVFLPDVNHSKLWGDIIFFIITTIVSILMLAHLGLLNGFRNFIDNMFSPKDNHFVPTK